MSGTAELLAKVSGGRLPPRIYHDLARLAEKLDGKTVLISIREKKKPRSGKQNGFYHGPFIEAIQRYLLDAGHRVSPDDIHAGLRDAYAKNSYSVVLPNGATFRIPASTARLSTGEFEDFLTEIRAEFAQRFGWQLPLPNEELPTEAKEGS
jgi:hypothetical protein